LEFGNWFFLNLFIIACENLFRIKKFGYPNYYPTHYITQKIQPGKGGANHCPRYRIILQIQYYNEFPILKKFYHEGKSHYQKYRFPGPDLKKCPGKSVDQNYH